MCVDLWFCNVQILKKWIGQMIEALCFVHEKKMIHRYGVIILLVFNILNKVK